MAGAGLLLKRESRTSSHPMLGAAVGTLAVFVARPFATNVAAPVREALELLDASVRGLSVAPTLALLVVAALSFCATPGAGPGFRAR
jgi:type IV secretory pathway VirB2 component (pilin)